MEFFITLGFTLNVGGLVIAGTALVREHRARQLGDLPGVAATRRTWLKVRRLVGRPKHTTVSMGAGAGTTEWAGKGYAHTTERIDPEAPAHEQVAALDHNMRELFRVYGEQQRDRDAEQDERVRKLRDRMDGFDETLTRRDREEQLLTKDTIHTEMFGLVMALLGTVIAAAPEVWSAIF